MSNESAVEVKIQEGESIEDIKTSVRVIEGMFHAVNAATFPLKWYSEAMQGMAFLKAIHDGLVKKLGPEEVAKIVEEEKLRATGKTEGRA